MTQIELDFRAGRWVPSVYGKRFRVSRLLVRQKRCQQEDSKEVFRTFEEAKAECERRNEEAARPGGASSPPPADAPPEPRKPSRKKGEGE